MTTRYCGHARIGDLHADVDITNVDVLQWKGTATNVRGTGPAPIEAIVTLLDQPRPGWCAHAEAAEGADGVLRLKGVGHFYNPETSTRERATRSRWVKKL
jgi:hypothetical protein